MGIILCSDGERACISHLIKDLAVLTGSWRAGCLWCMLGQSSDLDRMLTAACCVP